MTRHRPAFGFSLIEVLVALLVLSIGLLGLAGLQATGLRANDSAYARSQAQIITDDLFDRMRADRTSLAAYTVSGVDSSYSAGPDPLDDWAQNRLSRLTAAQADIACDADNVCEIDLQWDDRRAGGEQDQTFTTQARL